MNENSLTSNNSSLLEKNGIIIIAVIVALILTNVPYVRYALTPFSFFVTIIHEAGHGVAALLCGASIDKIVINPDTSGYIQWRGNVNHFERMFIASNGYMGAAIFGAILLILGAFPKAVKILLIILGAMVLFVTVFYIRTLVGWGVGLFMTLLLVGVGLKGNLLISNFLLSFLAIQCSLNALEDIIILIRLSLGATRSAYSLGQTDADVMQNATLIPAIAWSVLWLILAAVILFVALRIRFKLQSKDSIA